MTDTLIEIADKALLLAARWFKLNFDDDTLNEHPPSKADLAGMFDAMQEARQAISARSEISVYSQAPKREMIDHERAIEILSRGTWNAAKVYKAIQDAGCAIARIEV